jgi:hypothetical protein
MTTNGGRVAFALQLALALSGCCLGEGSPLGPGTAPPPAAPAGGTGPLLPGGPVAAIGAPLAFGPDTAADPLIATGVAGGPLDASRVDPSCYAGHYATAPSHVLTLSGPMPYLHVVVFSPTSADLTLIVQPAGGAATCNDDSDGLNPAVELYNLPPGEVRIYVGTYSPGTTQPYEIGVSANPGIRPTTLHAPPPLSVAATVPVGTLLLTGTATVTSASASLAGVAPGDTCTYTQTRTAAMPSTGGGLPLDCQWQITCGGVDLYGGTMGGGYQPCSDPSWPPNTFAMDSGTTATDSDPTLLFVGSSITVGDDTSGTRGAFTLTLTTTAPVTPAPIAPPVVPMPLPLGPGASS